MIVENPFTNIVCVVKARDLEGVDLLSFARKFSKFYEGP